MTALEGGAPVDVIDAPQMKTASSRSDTPASAHGARLRVALVGTRGPGFYGGFETCVAELAPRFAAMGHEVTVYARSWSPAAAWRHDGVRVVGRPSVRTKNLDTITHTVLCTAHLLRERPDVAVFFGVGNAPFAAAARRAGIPVVFNVDGLDRERRKWSRFARTYLHRAERWAIGASDVLVTDARTIQRYYADEYGAASTFIPYGGPVDADAPADLVEDFGLEPGRYVLYVSRLEPENNALHAIEAYRQSGIDVPLVVVGGATYGKAYEEALRRAALPSVRFLGFVFGDDYRALQAHAAIYVQCTEVGGSHPALIESMCFANAIVALDTPEHREVLGEAGLYYRTVEELAANLRSLYADERRRTALAAAARSRAVERYTWSVVADAYDRACRKAFVRDAVSPVVAASAVAG